jgi:hypothetical protein
MFGRRNSVRKAHPDVILTGVDWIRVAKANEMSIEAARPSEVSFD